MSLLENESLLARIFFVSHELSVDDVSDFITFVRMRYRAEIEFLSTSSSFLTDVETSGHVSNATYLRFLLPEILPDDIDCVLYVDSDVVAVDRIADILPEEVLSGRIGEPGPLLWAVMEGDGSHLQEKGFPVSRYFNAGVMIMNLRRWRDERLSAKLFAMERDLRGELMWWDQDVLNIAVQDDWTDLNPELNGFVGNRSNSPRIIHFNSHRKPWQVGARAEDRRIYLDFRKRTPYVPFKAELNLSSLIKTVLPNTVLMKIKQLRSRLGDGQPINLSLARNFGDAVSIRSRNKDKVR